jgi:hypothetical protein
VGSPSEATEVNRIDDLRHFHAFGFVVLRSAFDPAPLAREIDDTLRDAAGSLSSAPVGDAAIRFRYAPMMTARTPASLALLDRLEAIAGELLGGPVLPTRAKAVRYVGDTPWHADSTLALASLGCAAYLEPLHAENGALRVLPGSHHPSFADALRHAKVAGLTAEALPGHVLETQPGDVILFDEHLCHASTGGGARRQWRIDYVREPDDDASAALVRTYFGGIFAPDWEGGYDVDRHPTYGADWLTSGRRAVSALARLGIYELAAAHEARGRRFSR